MTAAGEPPVTRDEALERALRHLESAYDVRLDASALSTEEHHPDSGAWDLTLRGDDGTWYDVVLGGAEGPDSVVVETRSVAEISDALGNE